jgi:deoxyadenosine/deoxycytidine kinase
MCIELEGNIGCGKTTMSKYMAAALDEAQEGQTHVFAETVDETFLAAFYNDTKRFAFAFQMYMLTTRLSQIQEASRLARLGHTSILDRGAVGDALFAIVHAKSGTLSPDEMSIYKAVCEARRPASLGTHVNALLYLDVDPVVCHARLKSRGHTAEATVELDYLCRVDSAYFEMLIPWLAGLSTGDAQDLNMGSAPPWTVCQWDTFGDTNAVLDRLEALVSGMMSTPTVLFRKQPPTSRNSVVAGSAETVTWSILDTHEEVARAHAYAIINQKRDTSHIHESVDVPHVAMRWDITHSNVYRRTAMRCLAANGVLVFYGSTC